MLATHAPSSSPPLFAAAFLPPHPSPLSPRSANIHGPRAYNNAMEKAHTAGQENNNTAARHIPFAKRAVKKAPSLKPEELKERRRSIFLKKVKQGREDRRFEARGEDIMRLDFMRHQRAWEAAQALSAPLVTTDEPLEPEEDEEVEYDRLSSSGNAMQLSQPSTQLPRLEEVVDEVAQLEDRELEALLEFMPVDGAEESETGQQNLWSDDDDYDELFSELMEQDQDQMPWGSQGSGQAQTQTQQGGEGEAMDMS